LEQGNKLWKRMMIGAVIGAAFSLLDRETRKSLVESGKNTKKKLEYLIQEPAKFIESVHKQVNQCRQSLERLSEDVTFMVAKVKEIKEKTPEVIEFAKETKESLLRWKDKEV
jgi:gas vesicle protein